MASSKESPSKEYIIEPPSAVPAFSNVCAIPSYVNVRDTGDITILAAAFEIVATV